MAQRSAATSVLGSIPSPSSNAIHIGALQLRAYGLMIALGVIAAAWLFGRRLERRSLGTKEDASSVTIWAVIAGVLGSRLYHVITSWDAKFAHNPLNIFKIWEGGLGIPGGLLAGTLVAIWRMRVRGLDVRRSIDAAVPAVPLAQAIARWGNWWNQELFGRSTTLPWALKVDASVARDAGYAAGTTFHPTFLYESLGNFVLCGLLVVLGNRSKSRPGRLLAWYIAGYGLLRFGVESLRIDHANKIAGLRINTWVSLIAVVGASAYLIFTDRRLADDIDHPDPPTPDTIEGEVDREVETALDDAVESEVGDGAGDRSDV